MNPGNHGTIRHLTSSENASTGIDWAQAAGRQGRDRFHRHWTTRSPPSTTPPRCRRSATGSAPAQIDALLRKWLAGLPHPFTAADRAAGYRYDLSILQAEFSLTQMLDRPGLGADLLRAGHPGQPRHRPARPGRPDLRPAHLPRPQEPHPGPLPHPRDHRRGHPQPARATTRTPRSSSTTSKDERCAPRPPSTTPWTSASANG